MIPLQLRITGFLSYRDPVELDFSAFNLACISGYNGAGKSSLLDALTWTLFGEARGRGSDIINLHPDVHAAETTLTFEYEGNTYRVQRTLPRNKSAVLEFQVQDGAGWKPLSERTTRDTQARIEQTLRLDYETFVNASFFLQGKADQFTQQNASKRKDVLGSILGLEIWEAYKNKAAERRKEIEREVDEIEGRIAEIDAELSEEDARKVRLTELESRLKQMASVRAMQESALENMKKNLALLDEQRKLAATLRASLERSHTALSGLEARLADREAERASYADLVQHAKEVESSYKAWQKARAEVERLDSIAAQFRDHDEKRQPLLREIEAEGARLEEERRFLLVDEEVVSGQSATVYQLEADIEKAQASLWVTESKLAERTDLEAKRNAAREKQVELKAENEALKAEMNQLKERIDRLKSAEGAECPLCGQPLSKEHRKTTLKRLEGEGKEKGNRFRANKTSIDELAVQITSLESQMAALAGVDAERLNHSNTVSQLTERMATLQSLVKEWRATGKKRLAEVTKLLEKDAYAAKARKHLARLDKELVKLGYDTSAHEAARNSELELRAADVDFHKLDSARQVTMQIEGEIANLKSEVANRTSEIHELEKQHEMTGSRLASAEAQAPNLEEAQRELLRIREQENQTRDEVGAARQKVDILSILRARKKDFDNRREELQNRIARHKTLERAFGKDGVPALLIEQALPQIESKANDLLDRLSDGKMSIRFVTQAEYKDKRREDLKETLDIQISDAAGVRAYEMYSGGEAFRVNFAIRLALSEILAQRKGARLQTLVIDEGFGSQDAQGRQRLIEAINLVKGDFAKILVITHLDELKDAFPTRIEVEKTERGSIVRVV